MELITLGTNFQPANLVENYKSLVWTERYASEGDFQIESNDIEYLINALPLESYVSLRESTVPMVVEAHKIVKKSGEAPAITIVGRSFETVLERRASVKALVAATVRTPWMLAAATASDAAYRAMRIVLGDVAQTQGGANLLPALSPAVSANDAIPEALLTRPKDYLTSAWSSTIRYAQGDLVGVGTTIYQATATQPNLNVPPASNPTYWTALYTGLPGTWGAANNYEIKPQDLFTTVKELIQTNHHGMKAVRPTTSGTKVGIEIYNGADLTATVAFDAKFDQFDSSTYLLSLQGSSNVGYVYGSNGSQMVLKTTAPEPSGLARRVLIVDNSSDANVNTTDIRTTRGLIELYKYNATALFDGEIAEQVAAGFNTKYFLGDILTLVGEYGLTEQVRVAEYIRTSDATGEKAYPAFEAVS
jgi:hypothetical protein